MRRGCGRSGCRGRRRPRRARARRGSAAGARSISANASSQLASTKLAVARAPAACAAGRGRSCSAFERCALRADEALARRRRPRRRGSAVDPVAARSSTSSPQVASQSGQVAYRVELAAIGRFLRVAGAAASPAPPGASGRRRLCGSSTAYRGQSVRVSPSRKTASSTRRWNPSPAQPPAMAAARLVTTIAPRVIAPAPVSVPSSTGIRGRSRLPRTLYCAPAIRPRAASAAARMTPHAQVAAPCRGPVESRHSGGDVAAGEVGERSDRGQYDAAGQPDRTAGIEAGQAGRRPGRGDQGGEDHRDPERDQQAEEGDPPVGAAEAVCLAGAEMAGPVAGEAVRVLRSGRGRPALGPGRGSRVAEGSSATPRWVRPLARRRSFRSSGCIPLPLPSSARHPPYSPFSPIQPAASPRPTGAPL